MSRAFLMGCLSLLLAMAGRGVAQDDSIFTPPIVDHHHPTYGPSSTLPSTPDPEDGKVTGGAYINDYFQLRFPLLGGWQPDIDAQSSSPSNTGHYALTSLHTNRELRGIVVVDAQDMFFSSFPIRGAADFAQRKEHAIATLTDVIDRPSRSVQLAGHEWIRLDYSGAGIHHADFFTIIRCHAVSIQLSSRFPEVLKSLADNMANLSLRERSDLASNDSPAPLCLKDYASDSTVLHQVTPAMVGPRFTEVPARFVIDANGRVKHIHVVNALPDQAKSVEDALAQWVFKPYMVNGQPADVETGILFKFPPKDDSFGVRAATSSY